MTTFTQENLDPVFAKVLLIILHFIILLFDNLLDFDVPLSLKISILQLFLIFIFFELPLVVFDVLFHLVESFKVAFGVGNQKLFLVLASSMISGCTIIGL